MTATVWSELRMSDDKLKTRPRIMVDFDGVIRENGDEYANVIDWK